MGCYKAGHCPTEMSEDRRQINSRWTLDKSTSEEAAASTVLVGNMIAINGVMDVVRFS
jgi:hypothetical protein